LFKAFTVVCFGGGRFNDVENETLLRLGIIEKVKYLDGSDHQLKELYEKSACLVYPSLYEGFGLPVVEAMASGCPVFASDIPVLHESAGVAAKYFDPQDINSLIQALETNLFDTDKLQKMRRLGFDHAKKFTWVETAKQTYLAYKSIL
jgi:glycosyltransferase involved in cell wall biosynthesis